jgi:WD40 repeat protein
MFVCMLLCCRRLLCLFGAGGEHLHTLGADSGTTTQLQQLSWLGDNEVLACSGEEITVWHVTQEQYMELRTYAASNKAPIRHIAVSPNGRFIAAACENNAVSVRGHPEGGMWHQAQ